MCVCQMVSEKPAIEVVASHSVPQPEKTELRRDITQPTFQSSMVGRGLVSHWITSGRGFVGYSGVRPGSSGRGGGAVQL